VHLNQEIAIAQLARVAKQLSGALRFESHSSWFFCFLRIFAWHCLGLHGAALGAFWRVGPCFSALFRSFWTGRRFLGWRHVCNFLARVFSNVSFSPWLLKRSCSPASSFHYRAPSLSLSISSLSFPCNTCNGSQRLGSKRSFRR
jgi:hypothetical protein